MRWREAAGKGVSQGDSVCVRASVGVRVSERETEGAAASGWERDRERET